MTENTNAAETTEMPAADTGAGKRLIVCPVAPPEGVGATYVRMPMRVTAFQWDGELCLPGWMVNPSDDMVRVRLEGEEYFTYLEPHTAFMGGLTYHERLCVGDWVVIGRLGDVRVYKDELFRALYTAIPEESLAADADGGPDGE